MFYYMPSITEWVNQFDLSDEDYDSRFTGWGKQWKTFIEWLGASVNLIQLKLSEEQKSVSTNVSHNFSAMRVSRMGEP